MATIQSGRRDPRYSVRAESGTIEFDHFGRGLVRGTLRQISVSGISFVVDMPGFEPPLEETKVHGVRIVLGDCRLFGDIVVRHTARMGSGYEIGGLFHPASNRDVQNLMVLISGIDAATDD